MEILEDNETIKRTTCLYGSEIFDGVRLLERGAVLFNEEGIIEITEGDNIPSAEESFYIKGDKLIMPGLIDIHSDALEKCIEMRPGVYFNATFALQNLDKRLAGCGITTFCHAISFADNELGLRSSERAEKMARLVRLYSATPYSSIKHKVHARYEIGSNHGQKILIKLLGEKLVDTISFMDHTPGQGQFKTVQSYIDYYGSSYRLSREEIISIARQKKRTREFNWESALSLAKLIHEERLPFLSHDDDTPDKVSIVQQLGVSASEFPVTIEAAKAAKSKNMHVFMGAPNILRGQSANGHLRALDTIAAGLCDGLVSDYYPECLIQAPFIASRECSLSLHETLKLVTSNPGTYLMPEGGAGLIKPGFPADLIVIDTAGPWPQVLQTWVSGRCVYSSNNNDIECLSY
ncbi:MAG: alpha-D-ribose 1-methylphosphonate 5-triphosphate diphosphatase [Deltaproteobacteria bacterium]|nr:alpha-D-ribose 1-methylphosphonate 5-triphosphate diphosphatase [Deltaproteobacteria bacterium]